MRDLIAQEKSVHILGVADPTAARNHYVPSISKIQARHGLRPAMTLEQAILETADAYR